MEYFLALIKLGSFTYILRTFVRVVKVENKKRMLSEAFITFSITSTRESEAGMLNPKTE